MVTTNFLYLTLKISIRYILLFYTTNLYSPHTHVQGVKQSVHMSVIRTKIATLEIWPLSDSQSVGVSQKLVFVLLTYLSIINSVLYFAIVVTPTVHNIREKNLCHI